MYIENFINETELWQAYESVFISAPTGYGKTTFVLNCLLPQAKKSGKEVLFLSNRYLLKEQIKVKVAQSQGIDVGGVDWIENVEEYDSITIMTYQKLQILCRENSKLADEFAKRYKFVVYDEVHYIFADSGFNPEILFLLKFIKEYSGIGVFLSATMEGIPDFIKELKYEDELVPNSKIKITTFLTIESFRKKIIYFCGLGENRLWYYHFKQERRGYETFYFEEYEEMLPLINTEDGGKWLIFMSNKEKIIKFSEKITVTHNIFTADEKAKEIDSGIGEAIKTEEKFPCKVLLTTAVLDNGINIVDPQLTNIVIDTNNRTEFLQMLGRKRMRKGENIRLFLPKKSKKYFLSLLKLQVEPAIKLLQLPEEEVLPKVFEDESTIKIIKKYYCLHEKKLYKNPAAEYLLMQQRNFWQYVNEGLEQDEWFYIKEQLRWIGQEEDFTEKRSLTLQKRQEGIKNLKNLLLSQMEVELSKELQEKLCLELNRKAKEAGINLVKKGRVPKLNVINKFLEDNSIPLQIESKKGHKKEDKTVWIIRRRKRYGIHADNTF